MIIAIDFDGTICQDAFPEIGKPNMYLIYTLRGRRLMGDKLILWTCRVGERLSEALDFCSKYGLCFDAVNENLPEILELYGGDSRKIFADIYIDDKSCLPQFCSVAEAV